MRNLSGAGFLRCAVDVLSSNSLLDILRFWGQPPCRVSSIVKLWFEIVYLLIQIEVNLFWWSWLITFWMYPLRTSCEDWKSFLSFWTLGVSFTVQTLLLKVFWGTVAFLWNYNSKLSHFNSNLYLYLHLFMSIFWFGWLILHFQLQLFPFVDCKSAIFHQIRINFRRLRFFTIVIWFGFKVYLLFAKF